MTNLNRAPEVEQIAKELGLQGSADWMAQIQDYATSQVEWFLKDSPIRVTSLNELLIFLAERLAVKIEYVRTDDDLERIIEHHRFSPGQAQKLQTEINDPRTDGLLMYNPDRSPGSRHYLAVVDARKENAARAYFTAWHELTHLIVTPPQRAFEGFYRTVSVDRDKDLEESVVDAVAGELAFYRPFVRPVLAQREAAAGGISFSVIEDIRQTVVSRASFFATAIACVKLSKAPALLVQVEEALKERQKRQMRSLQGEMDLGSAVPQLVPQVRVTKVIPSTSAAERGLAIFKNMRVPERSVLFSAFSIGNDTEVEADEDQGWWATSSGGPRPNLAVHVEAIRRSDFVYGLITAR